MVVQHNLIAMNSNRMLGMTSAKQSKSSEKLSSGYKINRAADDAAGLAISEKMRKQIQGLDRASLNAQDGVSSVQTAEGALAEVHSMLQRMNELAVQAANGTNSVEDRDAIQSEVALLSAEIDRVSETTKFNETFLLKGSENKTRHYLVGHDAGLKGTLTDGSKTAEFEIKTFWPGDTVRIGIMDYEIGSSKEDAEELITKVANESTSHFGLIKEANQGKETYLQEAASFNSVISDAQGKINYHVERAEYYRNEASRWPWGSQNYEQNMDSALYHDGEASEWTQSKNNYVAYQTAARELAAAYAKLEEDNRSSIESKKIAIGDKYYTAEVTSNPLALSWTEYPSKTTVTNFPDDILPVPSATDVVYTTASKATNSDDTIKDASKDVSALGSSASSRLGDAIAQYDKAAKNLMDRAGKGLSALHKKLGDEYKVIESKYAELIAEKEIIIGEGTWDASYISGGNPNVIWTEYFSGRTEDDLPAATTPVPTNRVNGYRVLYEAITLNIMTDEEFDGDGNGVDDNIPSLITRKRAYENIKRELLAANNIGATEQLAEIDINVMEKDRKVRFMIQKGFAEVNAALNFALHVGSDADMSNKISVSIEAMSTANLGIEKMNLSDNTGLAATYAIDAISDALSIVSTQRSSLGAIQNRLEHTIDNLDNVVENTTTSESRIRDTDMAEEMVEYSKNNILAQAGQAMLAQANQSTQGVLSLLQ